MFTDNYGLYIRRSGHPLGFSTVLASMIILSQVAIADKPYREEILFSSGEFQLVGELRLPDGDGPFPTVIFVHGDGPNDRTAGVTYPPLMEVMKSSGYATFAWDKPGTAESTGEFIHGFVQRERAQIVLDAISVLQQRPDIDPEMIGLWGISQGGYVMPRVIQATDDIAFMIAVSCPGESGCEQCAYLLAAQAVCLGLPEDERQGVEEILSSAARAQNYVDYAVIKNRLQDYPEVMALAESGVIVGVRPEEEWEVDELNSEYFWDPMEVIEQSTIPILAVFGGRDTQADPIQGSEAYTEALEHAGNTLSRIVFIPETDHNIIFAVTGSLMERAQRSMQAWTDYSPEYLAVLEDWLISLRNQNTAM